MSNGNLRSVNDKFKISTVSEIYQVKKVRRVLTTHHSIRVITLVGVSLGTTWLMFGTNELTIHISRGRYSLKDSSLLSLPSSFPRFLSINLDEHHSLRLTSFRGVHGPHLISRIQRNEV